jgi:hypothetical protein
VYVLKMGFLNKKQRFLFGFGGISLVSLSSFLYFKYFGMPKPEKKNFQILKDVSKDYKGI